MFLPWSRHIGEGDIVVSDAAKACQDLGKWCNNQVLPVPEDVDVVKIKLYYNSIPLITNKLT